MGRKNKLRKFAEVLAFPNVYECYNVQQPALVGAGMESVELKGRWHAQHFKNDFPITLELACGAGEYTVGLAGLFPDRNFIGVDVKGNRIHTGAKAALEAGLTNVAFLRTRIEVIDHFFAEDEVADLWITFCDPFPRKGDVNRRLTSDNFHQRYRHFLQPGGPVHLKHDDADFVDFTTATLDADPLCRLLYASPDIYAGPLPLPELQIQTLYEGKHLAKGKTIRYLRYTIS